METQRRGRIAFFVPTLDAGGTEKVVLLVVNAAAERGEEVDLVLCQRRGAFLNRIDPRVRVIDLDGLGKYSPLWALREYLASVRPRVLYSALNGANLMALVANRLSGSPAKLVFSMHNHLGAKLRRDRSLLSGVREKVIRWAFKKADSIIAVSDSIRSYLIQDWALPADRVHVLPNPIDATAARAALAKPAQHAFFEDGTGPIYLSAGRLNPQKDYAALIRAFARVASGSRLIILGEGPERSRLVALVVELNLVGRVHLPGFVEDPLAWMARADVFALSSRWEGSPLVLLEAISLGLPIVSTDCPSGPAELLSGYSRGRLVPLDDDEAFAEAMQAAAQEERVGEPDPAFCAKHSPSAVATAYLALVP